LEGSPNSIVNAYIEVAENLGHEMFLYLAGLGKDSIIARVDGRAGLKESTNVRLAFDMNKAHVFDKNTEKNVFL
jgi:multiple sugar transport system ATP-binding protein